MVYSGINALLVDIKHILLGLEVDVINLVSILTCDFVHEAVRNPSIVAFLENIEIIQVFDKELIKLDSYLLVVLGIVKNDGRRISIYLKEVIPDLRGTIF